TWLFSGLALRLGLRSCPTRRSSDLGTMIGAVRGLVVDYLWIKVNLMKEKGLFFEVMADADLITKLQPRFGAVWAFHGHNMAYNRSEEHTSELQSRENLVCRPLLDKK